MFTGDLQSLASFGCGERRSGQALPDDPRKREILPGGEERRILSRCRRDTLRILFRTSIICKQNIFDIDCPGQEY